MVTMWRHSADGVYHHRILLRKYVSHNLKRAGSRIIRDIITARLGSLAEHPNWSQLDRAMSLARDRWNHI